MTTEDRKLAIAVFEGYKFGYYETIQDVSTGDDLNYCWQRVKTPFIYKDESELTDRDLHKEYDSHYRGSYRKVYYIPLEGADYSKLLYYDTSWNLLMPVVEKISKVTQGIVYPRTFGMIDHGKVMVRLNQYGLFKRDTLIEALFLAVSDFCENYNKEK
jgi:hypothetical protein